MSPGRARWWIGHDRVFGLVFRQKTLSALDPEIGVEFQDCRPSAPKAALNSQLIRANHQTLLALLIAKILTISLN